MRGRGRNTQSSEGLTAVYRRIDRCVVIFDGSASRSANTECVSSIRGPRVTVGVNRGDLDGLAVSGGVELVNALPDCVRCVGLDRLAVAVIGLDLAGLIVNLLMLTAETFLGLIYIW